MSRLRSFCALMGLAALWLAACQGAVSSTPTLPPGSVTLALLGDVILGRGVKPSAQSFAYLEPALQAADLALANLESPLTDAPVQTASPYALCAPPQNAQVLADAGFDLLSVANNHRLDCGADGLAQTRSALAALGMEALGPEPVPVYRQLNGLKLAFLAFDATADFDLDSAARAVTAAQKAGALVLVSVHWGQEYQAGASGLQKSLAEELAQAGAALVWGQHPHVLQPVGYAGAGKTPVFYSLGNALFDQAGLPATRQSALVWVTLNAQGVEAWRAIPFVIDPRKSRVTAPDPASAAKIMQFFER